MAVSFAAHTISVNGRGFAFTGDEYAILETLSLRKGMTLNKDIILIHLYGDRDKPELKIIDVYVCKLR